MTQKITHREAAPAKQNLLNMLPSDAEQLVRDFAVRSGEKPFRGAQVVKHVWENPAESFAAMTDLPIAFRNLLNEHFTIPRLTLAMRQTSSDGTEKFLFRLGDGEFIETVTRNLQTFEIAGQVREMKLLDPPKQVTNIVFMGMGEPLMNWKAVDPALTVLNSAAGLGIGARHITVSTVGVLPGIVALGERPEQFRLAISIHAPNDELRQSLMPINTKYPLASVIDAGKVFDRRVTFEYVMLGGINDQGEHALQLAALARECRAFVNLIPLHPGGAGEFTPSSPEQIHWFARRLRASGVEVAVRKSRGMDIAAACGQLRVERQRRRSPVGAEDDGHVQVA